MAKNGTVAFVSSMPDCDICKYVHKLMEPNLATHDVITRTGQWANVCDDCRKTHARYPNRVGLGIGQKLELYPTKE